MKRTIKQMMGLVLVVAMMATMLVIPAAAAGTTYVVKADSFEQGNYNNQSIKGGTNEYFTINFGDKGKIDDSKAKKFSDDLTLTNRFNFGGGTSTVSARTIAFTTSGAATVTVYWSVGAVGRTVGIYDSAGNAVGDVVNPTTKSALMTSTFSLTTGGTYYVGAFDGTNYFYQVEVTETAGPGSTGGEGTGTPTTPTTPSNATYTVTADAQSVSVAVGASKTVTVNATYKVEGDTAAKDVTAYEADKLTVYTLKNDTVVKVTKVDNKENEFTVKGVAVGTDKIYAVYADAEGILIDVTVTAALDKTALTNAITAAKAAKTGVTVSTDGSDVDPANKWTTQAAVNTLTNAITAAEGKLTSATTQAELNSAVTTLNAAVTTFNATLKSGTKGQGGSENPPEEGTLTLDPTSVSVTTSGSKKVTVTLAGAYADLAVYAVSADTTVATVAVSGKTVTVSGKKVGETNVYVVASDVAVTTLAGALANESCTVLPVKVTSAGGGGGSSSGGSSSGGSSSSTVTDADTGVKTKTEKDRDGNVTVTATATDGEVLAKVTVPASIPAVGYSFTDVPEGHWAETAINNMAGLGLVNGVDAEGHVYDMTSALTRGTIATVLFRMANSTAAVQDAFSDVAADAWYADGIAWAAKAGLVSGYGDGTFGPEDTITREQLALILSRFAKLLGLDVTTTADMSTFTDADSVSAWAADGMAWAVNAGIMRGTDTGALNPTAVASRAETAVMLDRFVNLLK